MLLRFIETTALVITAFASVMILVLTAILVLKGG